MNASEVLVLVATATLSGGLLWFFFGGRPAAQRADVTDKVQRLAVMLRGGYTPQHLEAVAGLPTEITFNRQESGDCTSRVVFPDFAVSAALPAYEKTVVRLLPEREGEFTFSCAMNMIHGTLTVTPAAPGSAPVNCACGRRG